MLTLLSASSHPAYMGSVNRLLTIDLSATCVDESLNTVRGRCDGQSDVDSSFFDWEDVANIAGSLSHIKSRVEPGPQIVYWPDFPQEDPNDEPDCDENANDGEARGDSLCLWNGQDPHTLAHEVGHNIHTSKLDVSAISLLLGGGCSATSFTGNEDNEKCGTAEGWAHFVSGAVWYDSNAAEPKYRGYK